MVARASILALTVGCSGEGVALDGDRTTEPSECAGAEPFAVGMSARSTLGNTVAIASSAPTPPNVGDNAWVLEVRDASGAPLPGLAVDVQPWMPMHDHGLSPARYAATDLGDGTYELDVFDLIMPGTWEFRVDLAAGGEQDDTALFTLCAEG